MSHVTGFSMVRAYRRCPKAYEYKYIQHLQRIKPPAPLIRGTIIHEMLDRRATGGKAREVLDKYEERYGTLFQEEQDLYGENFIPDIRRVYEGYLRQYDDNDLEYLASEEFLTLPLVGDIIFQGHIDKRIFKDGRQWIMDHKTHKNLPTEEQRFNDYQILLYTWAYNCLHPKDPIEGVIWDYIRTKPPTIPEQLQRGGLSQAKNIDTDYYTYVKELTRLKLNIRDYQDYLAELKKRSREKFYQRIFLPAPKKVMIEQVVKDFTETSQIMHGLNVYPRSPSYNCCWCEYYRICNAELRGLDHQFVRKAEYKVEEVSADQVEEE